MRGVKKSLALIISLMLVIGLAACGGKAKTYSIIGTWKSDNGKISEITFNEDGTGILKKSSEITVNFTYTSQDDKVTVTTEVLNQKSSTEYTYTVTADKLTLTNDYETTEYSKQ